MVSYPVFLGKVMDAFYGDCVRYIFLCSRRQSPVSIGKWRTSTGLEQWQYLSMDMHIGGLRYRSLFYQLEIMVNLGKTSCD